MSNVSRGSAFRLEHVSPMRREFFGRDPRQLASELLGKVLLRRHGRQWLAGRIVETEAYLGAGDSAAHAAAGRTSRNEVLFGPPGHAYVYFIYGNHWCLNVSCEPHGKAGCVLIRALEPLAGLRAMARARGLILNHARAGMAHNERLPKAMLKQLARGPGRLTQAFGVTRPRDNGKDLLAPTSDLQLVDDGWRPAQVVTTPRIGVSKSAGELLRYVIAGCEYVSGSKQNNIVGR